MSLLAFLSAAGLLKCLPLQRRFKPRKASFENNSQSGSGVYLENGSPDDATSLHGNLWEYHAPFHSFVIGTLLTLTDHSPLVGNCPGTQSCVAARPRLLAARKAGAAELKARAERARLKAEAKAAQRRGRTSCGCRIETRRRTPQADPALRSSIRPSPRLRRLLSPCQRPLKRRLLRQSPPSKRPSQNLTPNPLRS